VVVFNNVLGSLKLEYLDPLNSQIFEDLILGIRTCLVYIIILALWRRRWYFSESIEFSLKVELTWRAEKGGSCCSTSRECVCVRESVCE